MPLAWIGIPRPRVPTILAAGPSIERSLDDLLLLLARAGAVRANGVG
jgi:hypothetical protein